MKLHSLITCLVLSATNILSAQTAAAPGQPAPKSGSGPTKLLPDTAAQGTLGKLTVEVGPLEVAVDKLTDAYSKAVPEIFPGGKPTPMVIFGPGTRGAMLDAPLFLANLAEMRLVDAVALVAAEAGCIVDPIYSPPDNGGKKKEIIGYCIALASSRPAATSASTFSNSTRPAATPARTPNPVPPLPAGMPFRMVFKSYDGDPKIGPVQNLSFQIDMIDLRQPSEFLKLGEQIPNTRFKLLKFEFKETRQAQTNEMEDVSELTIMDMDTKRTAVLVLNKVVDVAAAPGGKKYAFDVDRHAGLSTNRRDRLCPLRAVVGIGMALEEKGGDIVITEIVPGSPADRTHKLKPGDRILTVSDHGRRNVDITGLSLETVAEMICGQPGTPVQLTVWGADHGTASVNVVREKPNFTYGLDVGGLYTDIVSDPLLSHLKGATVDEGSVGTSRWDNSTFVGALAPGGKAGDPAKHPTPAATPDETKFVRIYAIGSTLNGNEQERKEDAFTNLVKEAFDLAGLAKGAPPQLYFHMKSGVLIAKTTVRGHEILAQLVNALRKSEEAPLPNPPKP